MPKPIPQLPTDLLENAKIVPSRKHILPLLPRGLVWAEVGVALGGFSREILKVCAPTHFLAIDLFDLHQLEQLWGTSTTELFAGKTHLEYYKDSFRAEIAKGVVQVIEGDSAASLASLPDQFIDALYLDADHTYEGVKRDLNALLPKMKPNGYLILNDYTFLENVGSKDEYGVIQAGHEFMLDNNWEMIFLALERFMFCDVCLRRKG